MFKTLLKPKYDQFVGMNIEQIRTKKEELINEFAIRYKEIFGTDINVSKDSKLFDELIRHSITDMDTKLTSRLNDILKEKGIEFGLSTIEKSSTEQLTSACVDKVINELVTYTKSLCSCEADIDLVESFIKENIDKEELIKNVNISIDRPLLEQINMFNKEIYEALEDIKKEIKSSIELKKDEEQNQEQGQKEAEAFKAQANFVPDSVLGTQQTGPVDVNYTEVEKDKLDSEKKKMINSIEECTAYYYNKDRVLSMIGGQVNLLNDVMNKILETCNKMNDLVENAYGTLPVQDIKNKLSAMQFEMTNMIQSYNPNNKNDISVIIDSFKAIQVDANGNPIIFEDFFGNPLNASDINIKVNNRNASSQYDNSKILAKYVELIPVIGKISEMGVQVNLQEIKSVYKHISPVVKADLFIAGQPLNKPLIFDTNGVLFNNENKVLLVPQNGIEEDGIVLSLDNIETLQKYIYGSISDDDLMKNDIIDEDLRIMNRVVDLSSMIPPIRKCVLHVLNQKASKQVLNTTVAFDEDVRFKLNKWVSEEEFELISNSSVRKSFFGTTCRRKKQIIKFEKGTLSIGR